MRDRYESQDAEQVLRAELSVARSRREAANARVMEHLRDLQWATIEAREQEKLIASIGEALERIAPSE